MDISIREAQIDEITSFVSEFNSELDALLQRFCWTRNSLQETAVTGTCPFNPGHSVPVQSLHKHTEWCSLRQLGFTREEIPKLPASPLLPSTTSGSRLGNPTPLATESVDDSIQTKALLELEERLEKQIKEREASNEDASVPHSQLELLASMRDVKRRRQKYKVHTARKTHSEVLREVINNQMDLLKELWAVEHRLATGNKESSSHSLQGSKSTVGTSRRSRSRSPLATNLTTSRGVSESRSQSPDKEHRHKKKSRKKEKRSDGDKKKKKKEKKLKKEKQKN